MTTALLKNIATIKTGVFAKPCRGDEVIYLQAGDMDENGTISSTLYPSLNLDKKTKKHLVQSGDVLFARSSRTLATTYTQETPAVASTSFLVIRLTELNVLPEYLAWYINQPNIQQALRLQAAGTSTMVSISTTAIEELEIIFPELEKQRVILSIAALALREKRLRGQIFYLKDKAVNHKITTYLHQTT
jgi:hypothetical protein